MPETTEAADRPPKPRRRIRFVQLAGICVVVFVLGLVVIQWWKPWLNASETRMLGVWTWQDSPGEITYHYRDDGTLRYTEFPGDTSSEFVRWKIEKDVISIEYSERNSLEYVAKNVLFRRKWKPQQHPITFNADDTIAFRMSDGKERVLIPWSSDQGELLKQSE